MADMLTMEELDARVALLRRLRDYLVKQRERLVDYLELLEREEEAITSEDVERLHIHVEMEHRILKDLFSLQRVIVPLKEMYRAMYPTGHREIEYLERSVGELTRKAFAHNEENRKLLQLQMASLKERIEALRIPQFRKNLFASSHTSHSVDILT